MIGAWSLTSSPPARWIHARCRRAAAAALPSRWSIRQPRKDAWMEAFLPFAARLAEAPHAVLLGGDLNVAPTELDIHNPSGNRKNSGFLPHEREWFGRLLGVGYTDLVRTHVGEVKGPYSWWSNLGRARELDRGWRIDHLLGNAAAAARLQRAWIHRAGGLEVSDHAPITVELSCSSA